MDAYHELDAGSTQAQVRSASTGLFAPAEPVATPGGGPAEAPHHARTPAPVYLVWTALPDGSIDDIAQWRAFTGQGLDAVKQDGWLGAIHPDERVRASRIWADALAGKAPFTLECRVRRADRHYRRLLVRGVPLLHADGSVREWVLTATGVAEREERDTARSRVRQLEAILETMADGVVVFDRDGRILVENPAAKKDFRRFVHTKGTPRTLYEAERLLAPRDPLGRPLAEGQQPAFRVLRGETLRGASTVDVMQRALDGHEYLYNVSGAPIRDAAGQVAGGVQVGRDVTEQRRLERRTREALAALVAMAETLVAVVPSAPDDSRPSGRTSPRAPVASTTADVARRLAELTRTVMGCRQLDIIAEEPQQDGARLLAVAGLTEEEERRWRTEGPWHSGRLVDLLPPTLAARFERGESILIDHAQPEFAPMPNPFGVRSSLVVPMRLGGRLVGFIALDYGPVAHTFAPDELELAAGAARLAALVLERERLLREREEARADELALREANRRMDQFLAVATHELRSPVMASLLGVELAERRARALRERTPAREGELAKQIDDLGGVLAQAKEGVERLGRLVADLFDVSRMRAGQLDIRPVPADLAAIVRDVVARQRLLAPTRAIRLHLPAAVPVIADADRIGQVVANFVGNALKYAPEDRPVEVRLQVRGGRARVAVRDEGPGLSVEEQGRIWERYHQAPGIQANTGASAGLGLGLYIAREIVTAHGGQVGVRSAPGKGSTFWFTLPLDGAAT